MAAATLKEEEAEFDSSIDVLSIDPYLASSYQQLDMGMRFGRVSGSIIGKVLGTSNYGGPQQAALDVFQQGELDIINASTMTDQQKQQRSYMQAGHDHEKELLDWYTKEVQKEHPTVVRASYVRCRPHPTLIWLCTTADAALVEMPTFKVKNMVEAKWVAGRFTHEPPNMQINTPRHTSQCQLHSFVWGTPYTDLVIGSQAGTDRARVPADEKYWPRHKDTLLEFYNRYLRWYWEPRDDDPRAQAELQHALTETMQMVGRAQASINAVLKRRPCAADLAHMRALRERTEKKR